MNSKTRLLLLLALALLLPAYTLYSQDSDHEHEHHKYEVGVANSIVYFAKEDEFAYGLHLHVVRNIEHTNLGFGLAYERIFDEHGHNTIGVVGSYTFIESLHVSLTPGVVFEDSDPSELHFGFHVETAYSFDVGAIHLGPLLEFAIEPEGYHISLGVHVGFGF